jgi:hypothetical protein
VKRFLIENWGNLASAAGLIFSVLAFVFSKRASKAAKEARDVALARSLSEDMNEGSRRAADVVTYVALERGDVALVQVGELLSLSSYLAARWAAKLSEESKNKLLTAREQLLSIHGVIAKTPIREMRPADKGRLAQACQRVSVIFSEEHGNAVKVAD